MDGKVWDSSAKCQYSSQRGQKDSPDKQIKGYENAGKYSGKWEWGG